MSPPWRLAVFLLACTAGVLGLRAVQSLVSPWIPVEARTAAFVLVLTGGLLIGHAWTFREVDPRGWRFVGLGRDALDPRKVVPAALLGAAAIGVPSLALIAVGWLRIESSPGGSWLGAALAALTVLVPAALWEELLVRGYAFQAIRERWGAAGAVLATSLAFGAMHFLNAGASPGAVAVVMLAGVFFGLVVLRTESLYAAWAAHLAWNVVLVVVLHTTVSGLTMAAPGYRTVDAGPDWATGGAWGPEGGVLAALGLATVAWIINRRPAKPHLEPDT